MLSLGWLQEVGLVFPFVSWAQKRARTCSHPSSWHRQAPARTGTASRAPVGRVSHGVFCWGKKLTVSEVAPLPSRAARKLGYVSSMKVFDRRKKLMPRLCRRAPKV